MKKTVRYDRKKGAIIKTGQHAFVFPVDHDSVYVTNTKVAMTSLVVKYDETTGEFETQNSLYVPADTVTH
jgi:hypothetical protein